MDQPESAAFLTFALGTGAFAPALADGAASTRNIILGTAAAAALYFTIRNNNKKRATAADIAQREQHRRLAQYRAWYRWRNGVAATNAQARNWYYQQFGSYPT